MNQIECPAWARNDPPLRETNYTSAPPHGDRVWLMSLPIGERAWAMTHQFFADDRGKLWVAGRACRHDYPEDFCARVERHPAGVRVIEWPTGQRIARAVQEPNRYGHEDIWVVEFPAAGSQS